MDRRTFNRRLTRIHRWAGLGLGLFALSWFSSGFFMSLKPIAEVRGEHLAEEPAASIETDGLISVSEITAGQPVNAATLVSVMGQPAWSLTTDEGRSLSDAVTGEAMSEPSEAAIRTKAEQIVTNGAKVITLRRLETGNFEFGGPLPAWQVEMSEPKRMRLYFDAQTGQLARVRTRHWRAFDIAWRFHILHPSGAPFTTWWLSTLSGLAALFALSGLVLVWLRTLGRPKRDQADS